MNFVRGKSLRNETVRTFLLKEFEKFSFGYRADGTVPIQNKVGAFLADPLLNRILAEVYCAEPRFGKNAGAGAAASKRHMHGSYYLR
jgi:hypothetical protein